MAPRECEITRRDSIRAWEGSREVARRRKSYSQKTGGGGRGGQAVRSAPALEKEERRCLAATAGAHREIPMWGP